MYTELKEKQPVLEGCFFAFSERQLKEGIEKNGLEGQKLYRGAGGLIGTKEGLKKVMDFYEEREKEIAQKCTPQEIYDDEFINHECSYTGDDSEAMEIVVLYFGEDRAKEVVRKFNY